MLIFLAGCEDPSNVGLGLIPDEGSDPDQITLAADDLEQTSYSSVTGNRAGFAVGAVDDPMFGSLRVTGYLDFTRPGSFPDSFRDGDNDISDVTLTLHRTYVYGDTTDSYTLTLRSMPEDWTASNVRADTALTAGDNAITSIEVSPTDTLIEIPLPDSWIEDNSRGLRGEDVDFTTNFHGFQLSTSEAPAVEGFHSDSSALEVTVGEETAAFSISKNLSTIERTEPPASVDDRVVLQSGVGPAVTMTLPLSADTLEGKALSRARILLPIDRQAMEDQQPADFVRPLPEQVVLYGIDADDNRTALQTGRLDEENSRYVFDTPELTNALQRVLLGKSEYEQYLVAGSTLNAVNVSPALLYDSTSETEVPTISLTLVPLN